jgi:EH domain-containing protein 1
VFLEGGVINCYFLPFFRLKMPNALLVAHSQFLLGGSYGALMWSMGKVLQTPEVLRVYVGSFWDQPLVFEDNASLFEAEENDLMNDLRSLPRNSAMRKINELVKRTKLAKVIF